MGYVGFWFGGFENGKSCGQGFIGLGLFKLELSDSFGVVAIGFDLFLDLVCNSDLFQGPTAFVVLGDHFGEVSFEGSPCLVDGWFFLPIVHGFIEVHVFVELVNSLLDEDLVGGGFVEGREDGASILYCFKINLHKF